MLSFGVTPTAESTFPVLSTASREAAALQAGFGPVPEGLLFAGLIPLRPTVSEAKPALSPLVEPPVPGIAPPLEAPPADLAIFPIAMEAPAAEPSEPDNKSQLPANDDVLEDDTPATALFAAPEPDVGSDAKKKCRELHADEALATVLPQPTAVPVQVPRDETTQAEPALGVLPPEATVPRRANHPPIEGQRTSAPAIRSQDKVLAEAVPDAVPAQTAVASRVGASAEPVAEQGPATTSTVVPKTAAAATTSTTPSLSTASLPAGDGSTARPVPDTPSTGNPQGRQTAGDPEFVQPVTSAPAAPSPDRSAPASRSDRVRQVSAPEGDDTAAPQRTADVAGLLDDASAVALPNQMPGWKKLLLDAYKQQVKIGEEKVGIKDAKAESTMSALLSTPLVTLDSSAPVAPVAGLSSSFPAEWVEKLAQLTSRAERLAPARLEVSLPMEGAKDLRVRVSCRSGRISCEFQNVSSEMQRTFMREWPGLSQLFGRDSQLRVEQPTFVNVADPQQRSDGESSHRRQRDERNARNEDADIAAFFTAHRLSKSEAGGRK